MELVIVFLVGVCLGVLGALLFNTTRKSKSVTEEKILNEVEKKEDASDLDQKEVETLKDFMNKIEDSLANGEYQIKKSITYDDAY